MTNIRIDIDDLIRAARCLHEFKVVAAGEFWATIESTDEHRRALVKAGIQWWRD